MAATDTDLTPQPALYQHCEAVFQAMMNHSEEREYEGTQVRVYEGYLTQLIRTELSLPSPYYTFTTRALIRMDCIRQLRRGGGSTPSLWLLLQEPSEALFKGAKADFATKTTTERRFEAIEQSQRDLHQRLLVVEAFMREVGH